MNFPRIALIKAIRAYQMLTSRRIPVCRFDPTCSRYAIEAIEHHGFAGSYVFISQNFSVSSLGWVGV
jgi:putative membrane protein insertion efficiency factor